MLGTKNLNENGPNSFFFWDQKYGQSQSYGTVVTVLFWHGFDSKSKLVYAGEIRK